MGPCSQTAISWMHRGLSSETGQTDSRSSGGKESDAPPVRRHPPARRGPRPADRRHGRQPGAALGRRRTAPPDATVHWRSRAAGRERHCGCAARNPLAGFELRISGVGKFEKRNGGAFGPAFSRKSRSPRSPRRSSERFSRRDSSPSIARSRRTSRWRAGTAAMRRRSTPSFDAIRTSTPIRSRSTASSCSKASSRATARITRSCDICVRLIECSLSTHCRHKECAADDAVAAHSHRQSGNELPITRCGRASPARCRTSTPASRRTPSTRRRGSEAGR